MQAMASRLWSPRSRFHPGQLAWSRYFRPVDPARLDDGEAISIWEDGGETVGFRLGRGPDWLELQVDPAHPEVAEELLEWFEEVSDAEQQSAIVMEGDVAEQALAAAGFAPRGGRPVLRPPRGRPRRPAAGAGCWRGMRCATSRLTRRLLGQRCTRLRGPTSAPRGSTQQAYAQVMAAWPYRADLDWVVTDAAGELVASALVWLDPATGVGLVEPVGCVPEHRGRGLAAAVTLAALHHLRSVGGTLGQVTPARGRRLPGAAAALPLARLPPDGAHRDLDPQPRVRRRVRRAVVQTADQSAVAVALTAPDAD